MRYFRRGPRRAVLAAAMVALFAARVVAQAPEKPPVSQILPNLFGNTIVLTPTGTPEFPNHSAHFKPGVDQLQTPQQFNQQLVTLLATVAVGFVADQVGLGPTLAGSMLISTLPLPLVFFLPETRPR